MSLRPRQNSAPVISTIKKLELTIPETSAKVEQGLSGSRRHTTVLPGPSPSKSLNYTRVSWESRASVKQHAKEITEEQNPTVRIQSAVYRQRPYSAALNLPRSRPFTATGLVPSSAQRASQETRTISTIEEDSDIEDLIINDDNDDEHMGERRPSIFSTPANKEEPPALQSDSVPLLESDESDEEFSVTKYKMKKRQSDLPEELGLDSYMLEHRAACIKLKCVPISYFEKNYRNKELNLNFHGLGDKRTSALATSLASNIWAETVLLRGNGITSFGVEALCGSLTENPYISMIDLSENAIQADGLKSIGVLIAKCPKVSSFKLERAGFLDSNAPLLCEPLKNDDNVRELYLSKNKFGDPSAVGFGEMIATNTGLEVLDLSWNCFGKRGGVAIGTGLKSNTSLKHLNLAHNGVSDSGAAAIASALSVHTSLTYVNLSHNSIHNDGAKAIASAIKGNKYLTSIDLSNNPISTDGLKILLDAITTNEDLVHINLLGISIDPTVLPLLQQLKTNKPSLKVEYDQGSQSRSQKAILADRLKELEAKSKSNAVNYRRRVSVNIVIDKDGNLLRQPLLPFDQSWRDFEAWLHGYNPDGSIRIDEQWLTNMTVDLSWSAEKAWAKGFNKDSTPRCDAEWRQLNARPQKSRDNDFDTINESDEEDEEDDDSDDSDESTEDRPKNQAQARRNQQRRHLRALVKREMLMKRAWSENHPELEDPLNVIEEYVAKKKLRLLDLFRQMDRNRDGTITPDEMQHAVEVLNINLNNIQLGELLNRLDYDGSGTIEYDELCKGRRMLEEHARLTRMSSS